MALSARIRRRLHLLWLAMTLPRLAGGAPDDDDDDGQGGDDDGKGAKGKPGGDGAADDAGNDDDDDDGDAGKSAKTVEDYRRELRESDKVRKREAAKAKKRIAELEKAEKERADADKTESEKAAERADAAEQAKAKSDAELRKLRVTTAVMTAAGTKGIGDTDAAARLLDADAIEYDDDGAPTNIDTLLDELLEGKPYLKTTPAKPKGDADAGKGDGKGKAQEDMSVDEHFSAIQRTKK